MLAVNLNNISKSYALTEVLNNFSLQVNMGEKLGLIGPNGCGKTTVMKIIAGEENYSGGIMSIKKDAKVGYLNQVPDLDEDNTLFEELETVFADVIHLKRRLVSLETEISQAGNKNKQHKKLEKLMEEYSQTRLKYEIGGGYEYESKIRQVAIGLGFTKDELEKKTSIFSGGEKTRLGLVKLLLSEPDILLLDEPTNHLDIPSRQWLEEYLGNYQGAVIIVSHDRYFLDRVVSKVVEIKQGSDEVYHGNYSYYLEERKKRYEQQLATYENQQKKIEKMEAAIDRLHRWGNRGDNPKLARRAKSMQKALERIEKVDKPKLSSGKIGLELDFNNRSGDEVLIVKNVEKTFADGTRILNGIDLSVYRGDKSAIIGKNGTGKTTILKIINGLMEPDCGQIKIGASVRVGYYSQEYDGFNEDDDILTAYRREVPMSTGEARDKLASFLFTEDDVFKLIKDLSGGEKSRLRLLQLMNGDYNFLILDEPTNHLDLPSREILEEVLEDYPGTILVVSHDRYFLNKFIDCTFELENGSLTRYYGNYDYYRKKKERMVQEETEQLQKDKEDECQEDNEYQQWKEKQRQKRKREKELQQLEDEITELEGEKENLEKEMSDPGNIEDYNLLNKLKARYKEVNRKLSSLYEDWETYL